jgi:hypothetical protein
VADNVLEPAGTFAYQRWHENAAVERNSWFIVLLRHGFASGPHLSRSTDQSALQPFG